MQPDTSNLVMLRIIKKRKNDLLIKRFKKIDIVAVNKLIRTVYYLIVYDQFYDYSVVKNKVGLSIFVLHFFRSRLRELFFKLFLNCFSLRY
jgi:hypothetical protein